MIYVSPEGNVCKKKGSGIFFFKNYFFLSPLTMKRAFPKVYTINDIENINY